MPDVLKAFATRTTPQTERATTGQVVNSAGGFVFPVDDRARLRRFLSIGSSGGTYYTNAGDLTRDNAEVAVRMAKDDGAYLVEEITRISTEGRAPKQNPAIYALAIASALGDDTTRRAARDAFPKVIRTGTHLFLFAGYREQFGGWGHGTRGAVSRWYTDRDPEHLAYQMLKYRQREGWTHADVLRTAHPVTRDTRLRALFDWACGRTPDLTGLPLLEAFIKANEPGADVAAVIRGPGGAGLSWEMLPDAALTRPDTWDALLDTGNVPLGALIRQLPRLTRLGLLPQIGGRTGDIVGRLTDPTALTRSRIHPINLLLAHHTYTAGHAFRGDSSWVPATRIVDALDASYYAAYGNVVPAGKRTMLALDVSGSMGSLVSQQVPVTCREASAAIALVTAATEPETMIVGFTSAAGWGARGGLPDLPISPRQRLGDATAAVADLPFGRTDCALPFTEATRRGLDIDTFVVLTDSETYQGSIHPFQALAEYRRVSGIPARSVVVAMTSTGFSIANPDDAGMLDCAGMDAAVPQLVSDFSAGR